MEERQTALEASRREARVRLDKWLWAARFYKTRSQATDAIGAGHVRAQGTRAKAGHAVTIGQVIEIVKEQITWQIVVVELSMRRGSGADAAKLYRETDEGRQKRLQTIEMLRQTASNSILPGRPTKRDHRQIIRFKATHR